MRGTTFAQVAIGWMAVLLLPAGAAAVPGILDHHGRVTAGGGPFHGTGQFKFALVDPGVNQSRIATATVTVNSGFITGVTVDDGGAGYVTPPAIAVSAPAGSNAVLQATVSGGAVTAVDVIDAGRGYLMPVLVFEAPPTNLLFTTYWSNDGTSTTGNEPATAVALTVTRGLYAAPLGDSLLPHMTPIPTAALTPPDVRLRVWFSDGSHGFQLLTPDQRLGSVPYARLADGVSDGAITASMIAPNSIGSAHFAYPLDFTHVSASALDIDGLLRVDRTDANTGALVPGMVFGARNGEGIASPRNPGVGQYGLDFYTNFKLQMTLTRDGLLGIGTPAPRESLEIFGAAVLGNTPNPDPAPGTIRWNGTEFEGFNGAEWLSFTAVRSKTIPYNLAAGGNTDPISLPQGVPVQVIGVYLNLGSRGVGQATLLVPAEDPRFVEWTGVESPASAGITAGFSSTLGTHILYLDYSHTVDVEVANPTSIRVHNSGAGTARGTIKLIW